MLLLLLLCSVEDEFPDMVVLQEAPGKRDRGNTRKGRKVSLKTIEIIVIQARSPYQDSDPASSSNSSALVLG